MNELFRGMTNTTFVIKPLLGLAVILGMVLLILAIVYLALCGIIGIWGLWQELRDKRKLRETLHHPTTVDQL